LSTISAVSIFGYSPRDVAGKWAAWSSSTPSIPTGYREFRGGVAAPIRIPHAPAGWDRLEPEAVAQYCRAHAWRTEAAQAEDEDGSLAASTGPFCNMPLVVLSHDPQFSELRRFFSPAVAGKAEQAWTEMQEELQGLSTRSKRIVARGSYHYVQIYRPELVVAAVQEIVNDVNGVALFHVDEQTEYK
jgi:hypothetical protein